MERDSKLRTHLHAEAAAIRSYRYAANPHIVFGFKLTFSLTLTLEIPAYN